MVAIILTFVAVVIFPLLYCGTRALWWVIKTSLVGWFVESAWIAKFCRHRTMFNLIDFKSTP